MRVIRWMAALVVVMATLVLPGEQAAAGAGTGASPSLPSTLTVGDGRPGDADRLERQHPAEPGRYPDDRRSVAGPPPAHKHPRPASPVRWPRTPPSRCRASP